MSESQPVTHDLARAALTMAMRARVGQGKDLSVDELGRLLCNLVSERAIESYRGGESLPGLVAFLNLVDVLGPEFANEIMELVGMTGLHRVGPGEVSGHALLAQHARVTARLAEMMEDGVLDHRERRELLPILRELHASLGPVIAKLAEHV